MTNQIPKVYFKVGKRNVPKATKKWLLNKREKLTKEFEKRGKKILRSIEKNCGFRFPAKTISEGIVVYIYARRKDDNLGDMCETKPLGCNLYLKKQDSWGTIKRTLVHELIHCIMWQKFYFDLRSGKPTFFADIFADELMTSTVECMVVGLKPGQKICRDALDYAINDAANRLRRTDNRNKLVKALIPFFDEYRNKLKHKKSNILLERENILNRLPSLLPKTISFV